MIARLIRILLFRKSPARQARDRLMIVLAHERRMRYH